MAVAGNLRNDVAQKIAAVGAGPRGIGVGEVFANITQTRGAKQCVTQSMQHNIAIGVRDQAALVGNTLATEHHVISLTKSVHVKTVTDAHQLRSLWCAAPGPAWAALR